LINRITLLLFIGLAWGQSTTIAVFDLENNGLKDSEVRILTDRLQSELVKVGGYTVVERKKIEKVFEEQRFQMSGCVEECLIEIGMLLGAKEIVIGSAGRLGSTYTISARLVNATTGEMIRSSDFDSEGDISILLKSGMFRVASELTGRALPPQLTGKRANNNRGKGTLYIASYPSSADVWVDGYKVEGKTPLTIPELDTGTHTLQLVKDDYELTQTVFVKADHINKVDEVLGLSRGDLNVFSTPDRASVSIDGISIRGVTPLTMNGVYVGQRTVKITKEGYGSHEAQINIKKNETNQYSADLDKTAILTVAVNIRGAKIEISKMNDPDFEGITDNKITASLGKRIWVTQQIDLSAGEYLLFISKDGYKTNRQNFSIISGEDKSIKIDLELLTGSIIVDDKYPSGTVVKLFWNGSEKRSGNASDNINWNVKPQTYQFIIRCPGYLPLKKYIKVTANDISSISDRLESNEWVLKEIKSLKMKRNLSFVLAGVIAGAGGYLRSLADKQYTDYQVAGSNADEIRDKIETNDSLAPIFFGAGGVSLGLPLYYHSKIGTLTKMLSE